MTQGELQVLETLVRQHAEMAEILSELRKRIRAIEADGKKCRGLDARIRDLEQRSGTIETIRG